MKKHDNTIVPRKQHLNEALVGLGHKIESDKRKKKLEKDKKCKKSDNNWNEEW